MHQDASFELSKTVFGQFFKFFIIRGFGGVKKLPNMEKKVEKKFQNFFSNQGAKRNKKMGGRSHVITFGVFPFKNGTLYCTVLHSTTLVHCAGGLYAGQPNLPAVR